MEESLLQQVRAPMSLFQKRVDTDNYVATRVMFCTIRCYGRLIRRTISINLALPICPGSPTLTCYTTRR